MRPKGLGFSPYGSNGMRYERESDPNYRPMTEEEAAAKNDRRPGDRMSGADYERRNTDYKHGTRPWHDRKEKRPNQQTTDSIDRDIHALDPPTSLEDEEPYMDVSRSGLDAKYNEWRKKLRRRGYSDEEIEDILSEASSLHD